MFDPPLRRLLARPLDSAAAGLERFGVRPLAVTAIGLLLGLGSAAAAAAALWSVALVLWLASRLADGLDGPLARRRGATGAGGFADICADVIVYGTTVIGVAVGAGGSRWPYLLVLLGYYANGTAFLAFSSIAEKTGTQRDDGRSLSFLGGLAEGTETFVVHSAWLIFPSAAGGIAVGWGSWVMASAAGRLITGYRALR